MTPMIIPVMTWQGGPYVQASPDAEMIHLGLGHPSPSLLPIDSFRQASAQAFAAVDPLMLQYHRAPGHLGFRQALAEFLQSGRPGQRVDPENLFISSGNSLALSWCAHSVAPAGRPVVCENPSYFLARGIFADAGLEVEGVPVQSDGIDLKALEQKLQQGLRPAFAYIIPHHQNPSGVNLSREKAVKLEALAERHDFVIVYDDPYELLAFDPARPYALPELSDRAIRLGSFSKIYAPGLRLGWIEAKAELLAKFAGRAEIKSGGGVSPVIGTVLETEIRSGFLAQNIAQLRKTYQHRCQTLQKAIATHLPNATMTPCTGGYFVWTDLGPTVDAKALRKRAKDQGVDFLPGPYCSMGDRSSFSSAARFSFSFYSADELDEAMRRLAKVL